MKEMLTDFTGSAQSDADIEYFSQQRIVLTDDGTLDTVLRCIDCGEHFRFSSLVENCGECEETDAAECTHRDSLIDDLIQETNEEHDCREYVNRRNKMISECAEHPVFEDEEERSY